MCGLVGIAGKIGVNEEKAFKTMLFLDELRGKHSTGVAFMQGYNEKPEFKVVKAAVRGSEFVELKDFTQALARKNYVLIGHNRFATQGAIVQENSHPFEFENVIGAHNGSLKWGWKTAFHDSLNRVVDSEAIYSELNHSDAQGVWEKLNGAAALTWLDKTDNTVRFLRNKERPLFYTTANKGETLVWASEPWMIHVAFGREGIALDKNPVEVAINTEYVFDIKMKLGHKISVTRNAVKEYVAPKWTPSTTSYYSGSSDIDDYQGKRWLKQEGIKEGEEVEFTVTKVTDYLEGNIQKARLTCETLKGCPLFIYNIDSLEYSALLDEMWQFEDCVFVGTVKYSSYSGFIAQISSVRNTYFTVQEIAEAEEADEKEELEKEIKLLAASLGEKGEKLH